MDDADDIFELLLGEPAAADPGEAPAPADPVPVEPEPKRRSILVGVAAGLGVGLCAVAIAFSIVAIPMYTLASFEPGQGLQRDTVRTGLLVVALPFGLLVGLATGITVGIWKARGGHLPRDRTPIHN
ncbi:MAG: hypothetical protein M3Z03_01825 [Actinomycetota bacterium]|nr:hypothetical protein [Actinomycetota bacterium]